MIRLHISSDGPPGPNLPAALRVIADDIEAGGRSGEAILPVTVMGSDDSLGLPIVVEEQETRYVNWSLTWDRDDLRPVAPDPRPYGSGTEEGFW